MKKIRLNHLPFRRPLFLPVFFFVLPCLSQSIFGNGLIIVDHPVAELPPIVVEPPHRHPHPPIWPPRPRPPRPIQRHMPLDIERQNVEISIKDQVATTEVVQVFKNDTSRRLEGTFIFPLPANASVNKFEMEVNGEIVEAELLDAKKARKIYEDIVRRAKDPALFEYCGRGLFKVRIFPIEPRSTKEVRVKYTELLEKDRNVIRYSYPLNTTKYCRKPIPDFSMKVSVEASEGRRLKTVYSPSHEIEVSRKGKRTAVLGLEAEKMDVDQDFTLYLSHKRTGEDPVDLDFLTSHEDGADDPGHFMLLVSPAAWEEETEPIPKDVVFVFDSSGSMRGEKMKQARAAIEFCIENLNAEDRFEVVRFSTEAEPVFEELVDATDQNREKALKFIKEVRAIGGTAIEEALTDAMKTASSSKEEGRPVQIIFLTDGKPTLGATKEEVILKSIQKAGGDRNRVRVFCFGIGTSINVNLLDLVTESTRAVSQYVLPDEDIEEKVSGFFEKVSDPVLTDLKLEIDGTEWIRHRYPKDLPDVFRGDQLIVFGKYKAENKDGDVLLTGKLRGKKKVFELPVNLEARKEDNGFIAKLWAQRRVGYLLDQIRLHGESGELKEEVAELARKYGIVTPYTSYLIVEDEERRNVPERLRTGVRPASPAPSISGEDRDKLAEATDGLTAAPQSAPSPGWPAGFPAPAENSASGPGAVARAASARELKQASSGSVLRKANEIAGRATGKKVQVARPQTVAGKTFYLKGDIWVDERVQDLKNPAIRKIAFGSKEYFDLLADNLELTQWLSVGSKVQVVVNGELIEITDGE